MHYSKQKKDEKKEKKVKTLRKNREQKLYSQKTSRRARGDAEGMKK
jgi:hypothetical protein